MKIQVVVHPETEGGYSAFVPGFPGCTSCGDTLEETLENIREAFEGVFEVMQDTDEMEWADKPATAIRELIEV